MPRPKSAPASSGGWLAGWGWDIMLGSIAAFYAVMTPYTKVEESFNVQAMHDVLYHTHRIEKYDHLEFPGVVPRTFIGAVVISIISSPAVFLMRLLHVPKFYSLLTVRLVLSCVTLLSLRLLRVQVKKKFGHHTEAFFVVLTAIQFHLLFYSSRPLPNIFALALVNLAYSLWFKGSNLRTLQALIVAAVVFRCDIILLLGPIGFALLLSRSVSLMEAVKYCVSTALICIGITVLIDSIMWRRILWPEFEVLWFNSVLNRSSEWGVSFMLLENYTYLDLSLRPIQFIGTLPRHFLAPCLWHTLFACLIVYFQVGALLDRRIVPYMLPVFLFVVLYSKLPHKELRFIIVSIPMFNVSAALAASRLYNNRKKSGWNLLYILMLGAFLVSLGYSAVTFMASYNNYPGGYAIKALHEADSSGNEKMVHIDAFTAMSGVSRFCENEYPWRYSKEEGLSVEEFQERNFTYLLKVKLQPQIPPLSLVQEPKVFAHGNMRDPDILSLNWPGCR
nr:unnamed protein product [Digitaria exilis]